MLFRRRPDQAGARLHLKPGIIVMFEFGTDHPTQPVLNKSNIILDKGAEQLIVAAGRIYSSGSIVLSIDPGPIGIPSPRRFPVPKSI